MKNISFFTSALLGATISLSAGTAQAQGYDPGPDCPGIFRYPCVYVSAFCEGFFIDGPVNIATGVGNTVREVGCQGVDIVGGMHEVCTGERWQNWSQAGQYFDQGGSYGTYYRDFGGNVCTFGVYGQVQSGVQLYNGEITCDEASQRIGSAGLFQLGGARIMYVRGGPGSLCRQPLRDVPSHAYAQLSRCMGRPAQTPWEIANGIPAGETYICPAQRSWNGRLWRECMDDAQQHPTLPGSTNPSCAEACASPRGPMVCRSGQPAVEGGGGWIPCRHNPPFYWTNNANGGYQYYPCAMPRAIVCAMRNGAQQPIPTTYGGVMCRGGNLFYKPPCSTCATVWGRNPGLLSPVYLRPAPPLLGFPPGQNFRPIGAPGRGGLGCPPLQDFCGGGNVRPPFVDPPFEGALGGDESGAGCSCEQTHNSGEASISVLAVVAALLTLRFARRRRGIAPD